MGRRLIDTFTDTDGTALSSHTSDNGVMWGVLGAGPEKTYIYDDMLEPNAYDYSTGSIPVLDTMGDQIIQADTWQGPHKYWDHGTVYLYFCASYTWLPYSLGYYLMIDTQADDYDEIDTAGWILWRSNPMFGDVELARYVVDRTEGVTYHTVLTRMGDNITVSVDGTEVINVTDATYTSGRFFINVVTGDNGYMGHLTALDVEGWAEGEGPSSSRRRQAWCQWL
jgi:hypothetical protein